LGTVLPRARYAEAVDDTGHCGTKRNKAERTMTPHNLHYQITVKEYLEDSWSEWFDNLTITHERDGSTTLTGAIRDQSALHGLIAKIRDLGMTLIVVAPYTPEAPTDAVS
jgi:hypothetical protein